LTFFAFFWVVVKRMTDQDEFVQKTSAKNRGAGRSRWYHIHVNSFSPGSGVLRPGFLLAAGIIVLGVLVAVRIRDDDTALRLGAMDAYCEAVSPGLCAELDRWATENNWPTWLCGPTSWAMATELNARFFDGALPIVATPTGVDCIVVHMGVVRTPLGGGRYHTGDHVWVEVRWRGLIILVDPTYTRMDRMNRVVFAWFDDDAAGRQRMALFVELLRLDDLTPATAAAMDNGAEYQRERERVGLLIDTGTAPHNWILWAGWLQRSGALRGPA